MYQYQMILLILSAVLILGLGAVVYLRNIKSRLNLYYLLFAGSASVWIITNALFRIESLEVLMAYLSYGAAALTALTTLLFSLEYGGYLKNRYKAILSGVGVLFSVVAMIPGVLAVDVVDGAIVTSPLIFLYGLYLVLYFGISIYTFYSVYRRSIGIDRLRAGLVLLGFFISILLGVFFNLILPIAGNYNFVYLGPASTLILIGVMAYAIIKHRLFDIRLVIARTIAYFLVLATLGLTYGYFVFGFVDGFFPDTGTTQLQQAFYTISAVFLAFTFQPLKRFFDRLTDRVFYRDKYSSEDTLNKLGKVFVAKSTSFDLLDDSLKIITDTLKVEFGRLVIVDKGNIYRTAHIGSKEDIAVQIDDLNKFSHQINVLDEVERSAERDVLRDLYTYVVVRLSTRENLVGYLLLGEKRSGAIYTQQDINLLEILSQELAVAIQNAKSYEEIQAFSETLKKEVDEATAELKETNKRLVKLDEAKDEFISMASHQLRTPLTTIKGYLSMLLDGDAGKIPKKQKDFIDLAFVSSQRMVHLISDMLNVSRISTGRLTIDKDSLDLAAVVESELEQLHRQAEAHEVELRLHRPDESIDIELDENKIRQVIMNFTDNAIYYSPKGTVDVYIEEKDGFAEFRVEDNGIGVSEEAQKQLFTKFFRAENAQAVRPDGTGLGLYMAKQVIEAQDGEIIFKSKEGEGSTFGFRFKLDDKKDTDD